MNRMHIHLSVESLEKSVAFYSKLFGAEPTILKDDYAKWMLEDPRVNFAMSSNPGTNRGIEHIGIQSENAEELAGVYGRIKDAGGAIFDEGADGIAWEAFLTNGEVTEYGNRVNIDQLASANASDGACCTPQMAPAPSTSSSCC